MEGALLAQLALLGGFFQRRMVQRAKLLLEYRVGYGKRAQIRIAFTAPCVMRSPGGLPTPIAGPNGQDEAQDDSL
jgi:hypothetical protein